MTSQSASPILLKAAGAASLGAAVCLFVLAFLPRPPFAYSHDGIISGTQALTSEQFPVYLAYLKANLTFDGLYLLGHMLTWLGYAALASQSRTLVAPMIAVLGLISGGLDLLENAIRWAVVTRLDAGAAGAGVGLVWNVVVEMSFWAIYVAAAVTSWSLLERGRWGRVMAVVGLLSVAAAMTLYWRGFFATFCWLIVWHLASALYLWHASAEIGRSQATPN